MDLLWGRTAWNGSGLEQKLGQAGGYVGVRGPTAHVGASAFTAADGPPSTPGPRRG